MVFHVRHVFERSEGKSWFEGRLIELCLRGGLLGVQLKSHKCPTSVRRGKAISECALKVSQCSTSVRNRKIYEYKVSLTFNWYEAFRGKSPKQNH